MAYWICPSILAADFARLGEEVDQVLEGMPEAVMVHESVLIPFEAPVHLP